MAAKPGSQMGTKSRAILECLRKNTRLNRLDLEMKLGMSQLGNTINRLYGLGYIKQFGGQIGVYELTKAGRVALGEALTIEAPSIIRICNATSREIYNPSVHLISRVGVARV